MKRFLFILQLFFLFNSPNETNLIGENNVIKEKINKQGQIKNKHKYKIAGVVVLVIICIIIIYFFSFFKNDSKKEEKLNIAEQEKEDFEFVKKGHLFGKQKFEKIFARYKQTEEGSGLYILYERPDNNGIIYIKFLNSKGEISSNMFDIKNNQYLAGGLVFEILKEISDLEKFEKKYRNKPITPQNIQDYIKSQNNETEKTNSVTE